MNLICLNGRMVPADEPALPAANRGYRYGDGLFETIRVIQGRMPLGDRHFDRLFNSLGRLAYEIPAGLSAQQLHDEAIELCVRNGCRDSARVRLSISSGEGDLPGPPRLQYLIECFPYPVPDMDNQHLVIGIYSAARKHYDLFSDIKSANYLPYVLAARYARASGFDDALVLNPAGRIVESSVCNLFLVKDDLLITPPLTEGCIAGVMRKWIAENFPVRESTVTKEDLYSADELFLTNALSGVRSVRQLEKKTFLVNISVSIQKEIDDRLWQNLPGK